jgi:ketosteroid isomerase-like protein
MSAEAVDLARAGFEQFARGDFSAFEILTDEFELALAPEMPDAGSYQGAAARRWLTAWVDSFDRLAFEPVEFTEVGDDRVLIEFIQRGWAAGSDVPVELLNWSLGTVRDGRMVRWQAFTDRAAALEAVGLRSGRTWATDPPSPGAASD